MAKGGEFEREFAKKLSLWWSEGDSDAIFWRTSNSGGRATTRGKQGKATHRQHGDITATDPSGDPFIKLFTIECKRGYDKDNISNLFDTAGGKGLAYQAWISKAASCCEAADSLSWMLVTRRDRRTALVFLPTECYGDLISSRCIIIPPTPPFGSFRVNIEGVVHYLTMLTLSEWFRCVSPRQLEKLSKGMRKKKP